MNLKYIHTVKDCLVPNEFGIVAYVCVIVHFLCGLVFTAVAAALRASENGKFSCSVDAKRTATYKKQVDQACLARYDQVYNSPLPLYGFILLSIGLSVLVSVIYSLLRRNIKCQMLKAVSYYTTNIYINLYCFHLVVRSLFGIIFTVLQHTYFYPNGFDSKFSCNLPPAEVTSNITTPKNASRNLNSTSVTVNCENATASDKLLWGIIVSVINSIAALIILVEAIYWSIKIRKFMRNAELKSRYRHKHRCDDDSDIFLYNIDRKSYNVPGESEPLTIIKKNPTHIQVTRNLETDYTYAEECTIIDITVQDSETEDCIDVQKENVVKLSRPPTVYIFDKYNVPGESEPLTSVENNPPHCSFHYYSPLPQDSRNQDTPDSIAQEFTTMDNDIQDSGTEDCIDVYKKQVLNRSRDPGIIYGANANIDDLYIDVVIHTGRAQHNFPKEMKKHEIYNVYMKVPLYSICLERIDELFYPNTDTKEEFPRSILAIGRPGIGKTSLTQKILHDWANEIDEYYSDKIVFFFKFRWFNENINKLTNIALKTFLQFGTGLSEENFESIYEEIAKEPQKAILIFDGLDEYHGDLISCLDQSRIIPNDADTGTSAMSLFIKLVLGDLLKGATVVVTSRPTADDLYSRLDFDRNVEIIGFTFNKIKEYVSRFCDNNNTSDIKTKIWNHIKSSSELLNLCYIPVNCFIVCVTLSGCLSDPRNKTDALPTTLTELYQTATDHFEIYHHRNADRNEALKKLQRLAFLGMESGKLVFNQVLFDEQMKTSGLLNSLSNPIFPQQAQFCFIHLTIQEFLAARHVTETFAPPEIKKFISDHLKSGKWHLVLQFIAGLLGKKIKNFDREYKDCVFAFAESFEVTNGGIEVHYHEVFMMKSLREVDDEELTKEVCEATAINDSVELLTHPRFCNLSPSDWAAVTFVCKHVKKLANLKLIELPADCLPEVLGLLRKRCLGQLEMYEKNDHIVADGIEQVFSALMELNCTFDHEHTELNSLKLRRFRITETSLPIMCKFFENEHASQLEQLTLSSSGIDSHQISKLCEVLNNGHCPNLTHLYLGNNSIRDEGAMVLCDTLTKGLRKLNTFDVNTCELTDQCIPTLIKALQDERCQLTHLLLKNNAIGDKGVAMLFEDALTKEHCKLTMLDVGVCSLTDRCIPSLCKALQDERCQLTDLSLWDNAIGDKGVAMLFENALTKEHCKLSMLDVGVCSLTDQSIPSLCKALQDERCQLTDLSLWGNAVGDKGVAMLFEDALTKEHCKLTMLNLGVCSLTDQCIPSLCKALQDERCQLTDLSLWCNAIGDKGVSMLFEDALTKEHCKLTMLDIGVCSLTDQCIPSLCKALKDGQCVLTKLFLLSNTFTENGKKILCDIKDYKSCKAKGPQFEKPMDQDSKEGHGTHAQENSPELQASSSQVREAVDENYDTDIDIIKTFNTSDDANLQDETVDNVEQTDIKNRSIYDDRIASAEQLLILGISHETEGRSKEAIKSYEQAVQIADETNRNDIKSKAYQHLGNVFYETSEYKKAIDFYQKAHEISPDIEAEDKILQKEAYRNLGAVYRKSWKFDEAVKSYLKVKEISHDLGERKEEANACLMLGDTFQELKQHEEAIESYQMTLNISEELKDKEMQKVAMQRLGKLYLMASICYKDCDYEKAIEWRKKAIEWNEKTLDIFGTEHSDHLLHERALIGLGIDWFNLEYTEKAMESIHEAKNVAKNTDTAPRVTNQPESTVPPGINFTVNKQGQSVSFPAASAFFQFPAEAVANPVPIRLSCIRHQKCKVKPKNEDVFCSSIVKMEPEGYRFNKPVTVLLSHCAAQDGAYADYYDLTIQKLGKECEDLETEQLGKPEDLPEKTVSDFCDILEYLPLAQARITEASTLVATTRIRSEEIVLVPDEMYVYPRSYGDESDLEIIFPVGAVEEECRLTVQVFPVRDMLDVSMSPNDQLIQFPVLKVSGRDKPFLEPVEVVLGHSCAAVEELDEEFFPVDKKLPFTSKHGVLLRSHTNFEGNKTWENVQDDETAVIERSRKDRLEISFCVYHFCEWCIAVKKSEDVSTEGVGHTCERHQPDVKAICVAPYETDSRSERKLSAVVAPLNKSKEVKTVWGLPGEILLLKNMVEIFYCVPMDDGDHLQLPDNNIQFYQDAINIRYNRVKCDESVLDGLDMRFLRAECVDNKHFGTACLGKCPITPKQGTHMGETSGTSESPTTISCLQTSKSGHLTSSNGESNADDQITKTLKVMKERCEFFQKEMERFYKKRLKFDKKESKANKVVSVVGPMTSVLIGIGGGLVIAMSVPTLGIVTAFTGAAVAAVTLTVKIKDYHSNTKTASNVKELRSDCNVTELHVGQLKNDPLSVILTILKEVGIELSRIFEEQLFKLHDNKDVTEMASCAVNLMFKFKDSEKFDRNTLLRNVLRGEAKTNPKLKTKRNNKRWEARDVFQNPGLRKEIPTSVSSSSFVEFEYLSKANDTCDPQTYGYRGEILEMICKTTNNESEARNIGCTEPDGGAYDTTSSCCPVDTNGARGEVTYFVECDIDKEYTKTCAEANYYQPFHCLVRCPSILESFASEEGNLSRPSLRNVVSKMYHPRVRSVRPVYRPHSPRILRSLSNTDLSDSDFSRVNFSSSRLENCDLTGCTILFGELEGASLCRSQFKETYLSHCNLTGVNAQSCTWTTTKVHHSCADYADLRGGDNIVGGNSWEGTSLENVKIKGEPSLPTVTNQPEPTVPSGINADERQENGIATVSPMLDTSSANNNPLPRPIEDTSPSVPRVTNQTKQAGINADEEQGNGIAIVLPTLDTSSANNNYLKMTLYPDKYRGQSWV